MPKYFNGYKRQIEFSVITSRMKELTISL